MYRHPLSRVLCLRQCPQTLLLHSQALNLVNLQHLFLLANLLRIHQTNLLFILHQGQVVNQVLNLQASHQCNLHPLRHLSLLFPHLLSPVLSRVWYRLVVLQCRLPLIQAICHLVNRAVALPFNRRYHRQVNLVLSLVLSLLAYLRHFLLCNLRVNRQLFQLAFQATLQPLYPQANPLFSLVYSLLEFRLRIRVINLLLCQVDRLHLNLLHFLAVNQHLYPLASLLVSLV